VLPGAPQPILARIGDLHPAGYRPVLEEQSTDLQQSVSNVSTSYKIKG
jgi:hypothetical protein